MTYFKFLDPMHRPSLPLSGKRVDLHNQMQNVAGERVYEDPDSLDHSVPVSLESYKLKQCPAYGVNRTRR